MTTADVLPSRIPLSYVLAIDHTARNVQDVAKSKGLPWSAAKGFDHACAVGDFIPMDQVKDPHKLDLWYKVSHPSIPLIIAH